MTSTPTPPAEPLTETQKRARRILWVGLPILNLLVNTWRVRVVNEAPCRRLRAEGKPVIFCFWHGELLAFSWCLRKAGVSVMVSEHGDGEIIARVIESWGWSTVRGSTSRGAGRALLQAVRVVERGTPLAISPDGPRGPSGSVQAGILYASQRNGTPIVPLRFVPSRCWRLEKSWDRFTIPKPFAQVTVHYGTPWIATGTDEASGAALAALMGEPHGAVPTPP